MPDGRLDLDVQRNLGQLLSTTFETFGRHSAVFLSVTLIVVAPVMVLVDGVWGRQLAEGYGAHAPVGAGIASILLTSIIVPSLVTALHVAVLLRLACGEMPTVSGALEAAAERVRPAIGAVALYGVVVLAGLFALVLPGIWLAVRLYFAAQAAVVDGLGPVQSLKRSAELVRGSWWRTFGLLLTIGAVFGAFRLVVDLALRAVDSGLVWVLGGVVIQTLLLSLTALFGTLLFFDLRSRRRWPWRGPGRAYEEMTAPERPSLGSPS